MVCVLLVATHAWAESRGRALDLRWLAPDSCPNAAGITQRLEQQLGHPLDSAPSPVVASAVVSRQKDGRFRVELETVVRAEVRDRTLEGTSCDSLADAVAVVLAFLIDPDAAAAHSAAAAKEPLRSESTAASSEPLAAPSQSVASPAQPETAPIAPSTPAPQASSPQSNQPSAQNAGAAASSGPTAAPTAGPSPGPPWFTRTLVGVDSGALPAATLFAGIALGRAFGPFSLELSGLGFVPRERVVSNVPVARGGNFQLWALGAAAGYRVFARGVELAPFLGVESGTVEGTGFGVAEPKQGKGLWLAATAALQARYRLLPWLGAEAGLGAALPFTRPQYVLDNVGGVYQSDFITFRGTTGLEAYF
jgi:hypothetical protein